MPDSSHPTPSASPDRVRATPDAGAARGRATATQIARIGQAVEAAHDGIGIVDLEGRVVYMNPALRALVGYDADTLEAGGGPLHLFADPGAGRAAFLWAVRDGSWTGEVEMRGRSGSTMTVLLRVSMIRDGCGRALGLVGVHTDVTEQKRIEQALHWSEARNRAFVEALPDLVILFSPDGIVRDVQAPSGSPFLIPDSAVGRPVRAVLPPDLAAQLEKGLAAALASGVLHTDYVTNEVEGHMYEFRVVRIDDDGLLGVLRDVTERHRLEAEVLRATDEERRRLGRDLHDGLGSHLVGLGMLVRGLARRSRETAPDLTDELVEVARLIDEGAEQARALAHGLNPVDVDGQGPAVALARLAADTDAHTDLRCTFEASPDLPPLRSEVAMQLYRIAQEAVTNALRHAEATRVTISLSVEGDAVVLTVEDDGRGLAGTPRPQERGLGLQTMAYRARMIGGKFDLRANPAGGLVVVCRVPMARAEAGATGSKRAKTRPEGDA
ncbi:MAG: PAS domain S-box protein [Rhodothermales bacterium]